MVTQHSVLLFHPMKWQSEEHVGLSEAAEWARHFGHLEIEMDRLLAELFQTPLERISKWITPGTYITGRELAEAGLAELIELTPLSQFELNGAPKGGKPAKSRR
jgi:ATP-dependent protease ClpP protease subunit